MIDDRYNPDKLVFSEYPAFGWGCGCSMQRTEKRDCFFYHEEKDMGATVPCCSYFNTYSECPCDGCKKYIEMSKVFSIVKGVVDKEEEPAQRK